MALKLVLALAAVALAGCASTDYGYAYCYDAYGGPVGYYTGPFDPKPACARQPTAQAAGYVAHEAGYRGTYVSGPYPVSPAEAR